MKREKICVRCGRVMTYRKAWAKTWDEVKYCSDRCRRARRGLPNDEDAIMQLLRTRGAGKTICPSEILDASEKTNGERMEEVRQAARRLVHAGKIVITQKGRVVDPSSVRGPIRLKLVRASDIDA